jgi:hypothetical protein
MGASVGGLVERVNRHIGSLMVAAATWSASMRTGVKEALTRAGHIDMGRLSNTFSLWPLGARNSSASSPTTARLGEYIDEVLIVHVSAISGPGARLTPYWQVSDGVHFGDVARGVTMTATGTRAVLLTAFGQIGRPRWVAGGTSPNITAAFTIVAKE